jgi:hypothetical protein
MSSDRDWERGFWTVRTPSLHIHLGRKWTAETTAAWNREHSDAAFRDALLEFHPPFTPTESGVLFRDRRAVR